MRRVLAACVICATISTAVAAQTTRPTLFIIGDSTVRNSSNGQRGWGDPIADHFDRSRINIVNKARGGRSSRTFQTEGLWDEVLAQLKPGDFVMIQFGHNDGGPLDDEKRARGSIRGMGDESREIFNPIMKKQEVVQTFGSYMSKYIADARAKGATPIVVSYVPRAPRPGAATQPAETAPTSYALWAQQVAEREETLFIDLHGIVSRHYATMSPEALKEKYFAPDNTHTNEAGAARNAQAVVEGVRALKDVALAKYLLAKPTGTGARTAPRTSTAPGTAAAAGQTFDFAPGQTPPTFSIPLAEGNYDVAITFGDEKREMSNTVEAESRQLMLERVDTKPGEFVTRTFTVNVRTPQLLGGERVRLKDRERPALRWDDKLSLELNGKRPSVKSIRITPRKDAITVFLAGDSTVTDQFEEPWAAWGQMLPRFFKSGVAVANHAESGESLRSFRSERRLEKQATEGRHALQQLRRVSVGQVHRRRHSRRPAAAGRASGGGRKAVRPEAAGAGRSVRPARQPAPPDHDARWKLMPGYFRARIDSSGTSSTVPCRAPFGNAMRSLTSSHVFKSRERIAP